MEPLYDPNFQLLVGVMIFAGVIVGFLGWKVADRPFVWAAAGIISAFFEVMLMYIAFGLPF
jgi:hypothetical protein